MVTIYDQLYKLISHQKFAGLIKNVNVAESDPTFQEKLMHHIFSNYRIEQNQPRGLRLTSRGYIVLRSMIKNWTIPFPEKFSVTSVHLLHLDDRMKMPYYFNAKAITVFDQKEATFLKLAGGDLAVWCRSTRPPNIDN